MKKTLIALAAVAATGAAFAQSSVTLYGVADVAVGKANKVGLGLSNDQFQAIASNVLNNGNSRFGMKGSEDLGGGLKANFNFEGGINIANGAGNTSGGQLFSRAAWVALQGGFGELRAGRTLTTSFYSVANWELTGTANYSAVANQFSFAGVGPRDSAAVMYNSPNFNGFSVSASTVLKGNCAYTAASTGATDCGTNTAGKGKYDLSATYAAGPVVASLAYNKVSGSEKNWALGGKYDFGSFAVAASYQDPAGKAKGFTLGASAPVGPVTLTFDVARDTEYKDTDFVLEAKYALSKRTFVYGVVMGDGKGKNRTTSATGYALGLRHNF